MPGRIELRKSSSSGASVTVNESRLSPVAWPVSCFDEEILNGAGVEAEDACVAVRSRSRRREPPLADCSSCVRRMTSSRSAFNLMSSSFDGSESNAAST